MNVLKRLNRIAKPELFTIALIICNSIGSNTQVNTEYTHQLTTVPAILTASRAVINLPDLLNNPNAIIIATPTGTTSNPNPTGAWYYSGKWNLFNTNHVNLVVGLTYKITYFLNSGPDQFVHSVTPLNLGSDGSYIDHAKLNGNPNVQFAFFQNHGDHHPLSVLNQHKEKIGYSTAAGKWYITNVGGQPLLKGAMYNIVITSPGVAPGGTNPGNTSSPQSCNCPASLPPNGQATGDLTGTYPAPAVQKLLGRPLSNTAPAIGQVLKWNGTEWAPADDNTGGTGTTTGPAATMPTFFKNGNNSVNVVPTGGNLPLPELTHSVNLGKKSRLVVSGMIDLSGDDCFTCNTSSQGLLNVIIDGTTRLFLNIDVPAKSKNSATVSNFMIDLNPGNHTVRFEVKHSAPTSKLSVTARHSSIMVIPLE